MVNPGDVQHGITEWIFIVITYQFIVYQPILAIYNQSPDKVLESSKSWSGYIQKRYKDWGGVFNGVISFLLVVSGVMFFVAWGMWAVNQVGRADNYDWINSLFLVTMFLGHLWGPMFAHSSTRQWAVVSPLGVLFVSIFVFSWLIEMGKIQIAMILLPVPVVSVIICVILIVQLWRADT